MGRRWEKVGSVDAFQAAAHWKENCGTAMASL